MQRFKFFANGNRSRAKMLAAAFFIVILLWFAATNGFSSQFGVNNSVAQTMGAAGRMIQQTSDALNSFIGRSPGERGATDILKGKARRAGLDNEGTPVSTNPAQRALGKIFDNPADNLIAASTPEPVVVSFPDGIFGAPIASSSGAVAPVTGGSGGGGGGGIGGIGGGGGGIGGGGGGGGAIAGPAPVPPVISAVPEPSTWALLIFGFGAIGASLRRANALSRRAGLCAKS